jgi:hypothetical protein
VATFALDAFEAQVESFCRARGWREWQYGAGLRPGRSLVTLYDEDFPDFTSTDLFLDLRAADDADPRRVRALSALLASAYLEGRTREFASRAARFQATAELEWEGQHIPWREAPAHWTQLPEVSRRHALAEAWRSALKSELNPLLERWHEALRAQLTPLGANDWLSFWAELRVIDLAADARLSTSVLDQSADVFGHALSVYLGQLALPIDDVWSVDVDWAMRAQRFDSTFTEIGRMPLLVRAFRDLGIEIEAQSGLHMDATPVPGLQVVAVDVPNEVHVLQRLGGGYQDVLRSLHGLATAEHLVQTDATLPAWQRWLGDPTPTIGSGLLMEGLGRDKVWLANRLDFVSSTDYLVISHLAWLYRVRRAAAGVLYEHRMWQVEPGGSLAADFEVDYGSALRTRYFGDDYMLPLLEAPWSTMNSGLRLRAEVFAAHVRAYLEREFDEEWWRSPRAARFLSQELWRPGRRHTAEELLGFMGFVEGFDTSVLLQQMNDVLAPL